MISAKGKNILNTQYPKVILSLEKLIFDIQRTFIRLKHERAKEYCRQGIMRRVFLLIHCLKKTYKISPPLRGKHLSQEEREDLSVYLQSTLINTSGLIDNWAWLWFYEVEIFKKVKEEEFKHNIDLRNKKYQEHLTQDMTETFQTFRDWFDYLKEFRDPIAHRIPPYIIPFFVNKTEVKEYKKLSLEFEKETDIDKKDELLNKMDNFGRYEPIYTHSFLEKSPLVALHPQLLANANTIIAISDAMIKGLDQKIISVHVMTEGRA